MRKKRDSKQKKIRRTVRNLRHRKIGKYIGGGEQVMVNDLINDKIGRINNNNALNAFNKIQMQHTEAKLALNNAIMKLEEAEEQKKRETDENDKYHAYISEERMTADEDNLYNAKQELYKAEDKFEELENEFISAQAYKEACQLYKTEKADLSFFGKMQVSKLSLSNLGIIEMKTRRVYETIHNNIMQTTLEDYKNKETVYKTTLDEVIKTATANIKRGFLGLFRTKDKDKDKDREALYKYYKAHNNIKEQIKNLKNNKNEAKLKYEKYRFLDTYLEEDWDDAKARLKLPLANYHRDLNENALVERKIAKKIVLSVTEEEDIAANARPVVATSGDIHGPTRYMEGGKLAAYTQWRDEAGAKKYADIGGHKKNNTKRRRRNTKKQLIMKRK